MEKSGLTNHITVIISWWHIINMTSV